MTRLAYCDGIREAFEYCMTTDPKCFAIGQGLWSPWYVGRSMDKLDEKFGRARVIDTPVSEQATTGIAVGAALLGYRPIVIHPRMDFMILATDQIVNQAAKWRHMLGGQVSPAWWCAASSIAVANRARNIARRCIAGMRTSPACAS